MMKEKKSSFRRHRRLSVAIITLLISITVIYFVIQSYNSAKIAARYPLATKNLDPTSPTYVENVVLQEGNNQPQTKIQPKKSEELEDNHIGIDTGPFTTDAGMLERLRDSGVKWVRVGFVSPDPLCWQWVLRSLGVYEIDQKADDFVTGLSDNGINVVLMLGVGCTGLSERVPWNPQGQGWGALGDSEPEWWFKTQEDLDNYIDFVKFMAEHFKGRVKYYEIWNEPNCGKYEADIRGGITLEDYRKVLKQVAVVIKEEDPQAKIVAGAVGSFEVDGIAWLKGMLEDGVAPLVDYISWHPFYGESPYSDELFANSDERFGHTSWRDYAFNVDNLKKEVGSLGFRGGYMAEEMIWNTPTDYVANQLLCTDFEAAKYAARAIIMNLQLNITMADNQIRGPYDPISLLPRQYVIRTLCTTMAGATPSVLALQLSSNAENLKNATFVLPNGDLLVALWNDIIAADSSVGKRTNVTVKGFAAQSVTGIDTLNGFTQPLNAEFVGENTAIDDLLVGDYPMIIKLSVAKKSTSETSNSASEVPLWIIPIVALVIVLVVVILSKKKK
jgi:hypothetical protein